MEGLVCVMEEKWKVMKGNLRGNFGMYKSFGRE
jgi:hypothetical protein